MTYVIESAIAILPNGTNADSADTDWSFMTVLTPGLPRL
jgi:hypothetical protein